MLSTSAPDFRARSAHLSARRRRSRRVASATSSAGVVCAVVVRSATPRRRAVRGPAGDSMRNVAAPVAGRVEAHVRHVDAPERGSLIGGVPAGLPNRPRVGAQDRGRTRAQSPRNRLGGTGLRPRSTAAEGDGVARRARQPVAPVDPEQDQRLRDVDGGRSRIGATPRP